MYKAHNAYAAILAVAIGLGCSGGDQPRSSTTAGTSGHGGSGVAGASSSAGRSGGSGGSGGSGTGGNAGMRSDEAGAGGNGGAPARDAGSTVDAPSSSTTRLLPPDGKTLLIVGQDLGSIAGYVAGVWPTPGGVTTYTDISEAPGKQLLAGLETLTNYGSGDIHAAALLDRYPGSALAIGLYLVDNTGTNLDHIADGTHDAAIDKLGAFIRRAARPVYLRIGYEFDGEWNHYDPTKYKAAFRHIVTRLREAKTDNFAAVWQSATYQLGRYRGLPLDSWYPGDDVVDWCASSYFKFSRGPHDELLSFARAHHKPVLIAESAPQGYELDALTYSEDGKQIAKRTSEQIWDQWFAPYFAYIHANSDVIRAVAYIDCDWNSQPLWGPSGNQGYWGDTRVEADAMLRERWLAEIKTPFWVHGAAK